MSPSLAEVNLVTDLKNVLRNRINLEYIQEIFFGTKGANEKFWKKSINSFIV